MRQDRVEGTAFPREDVRQILPLLIPPLVHRLNNSLAVVAGALATAIHTPTDGEFERMRVILRHLSLFSRDNTPSLETFEMGTVMEAVQALVGPLATSRGVQLECLSPSSPSVVRADGVLLQQTMIVLVAAEVLTLGQGPEDGADASLRLRVSMRSGCLALSLTRSCERGAEFEPSDVLRRAVAHADELGMQVLVRRLGRASCNRFVFTDILPASQPDFSEARTAEGASLLLVERDAELRDLIATFLSEAGYDVRTASDVGHAGEFAASNAALLLLDSDLERSRPALFEELLDCAELLHRTLFLGELPSGVRGNDAEHRSLRKPFRPNELLAAVQQRLEYGVGTRSGR